jgi:hypothetical protein
MASSKSVAGSHPPIAGAGAIPHALYKSFGILTG